MRVARFGSDLTVGLIPLRVTFFVQRTFGTIAIGQRGNQHACRRFVIGLGAMRNQNMDGMHRAGQHHVQHTHCFANTLLSIVVEQRLKILRQQRSFSFTDVT